jgi:hypothetical protein
MVGASRKLARVVTRASSHFTLRYDLASNATISLQGDVATVGFCWLGVTLPK